MENLSRDIAYNCKVCYRFSFNGKECDNEVKGLGNHQDYGMRIYDPRLGKFLSVDPLTKDYSWYTPYQFAGNKPIWASDLDGKEEFFETNYYDSNDNLYKTVINLASDRGIKEGVYTVFKTDVKTVTTTDASGNVNTDFVKFYNGNQSAQATDPSAFSSSDGYQLGMGRNLDGSVKITRQNSFLVTVSDLLGNIFRVQADGKSYAPVTFSSSFGTRSPNAEYQETVYEPGSTVPLIPQDNQSMAPSTTIILNSKNKPGSFTGTEPNGNDRLGSKTNAVPPDKFQDTNNIKAQGGDASVIN